MALLSLPRISLSRPLPQKAGLASVSPGFVGGMEGGAPVGLGEGVYVVAPHLDRADEVGSRRRPRTTWRTAATDARGGMSDASRPGATPSATS